jgi:hypothetical protein
MEKTEAQQATAMQAPEPGMEHAWLKKLVGEWEFEGEARMAPGEPEMKHAGSATKRMLGEIWLVDEGTISSPEGPSFMSLALAGYDPEKKSFVGSFVDSLETHLWISEGELDAGGNRLNLTGAGPSGTEAGKTVTYRDSIEVVDDDHHTLTSEIRKDNGEWQVLMTSRYTRKR